MSDIMATHQSQLMQAGAARVHNTITIAAWVYTVQRNRRAPTDSSCLESWNTFKGGSANIHCGVKQTSWNKTQMKEGLIK